MGCFGEKIQEQDSSVIHGRVKKVGVVLSNNSILKILAIIVNRCPLRIHLKIVFLKSSEFCVQVGSFP